MKTSKHTTKKTARTAQLTTGLAAANNTGITSANLAGAKTDSANAFFAEPFDPVKEGREQGFEVIRHLLIWMADAPTLEKRGLRATVALHCLRPDLIDGVTLESIGDGAGYSRQTVHKLARDFHDSMGLAQ